MEQRRVTAEPLPDGGRSDPARWEGRARTESGLGPQLLGDAGLQMNGLQGYPAQGRRTAEVGGAGAQNCRRRGRCRGGGRGGSELQAVREVL